MAGAWPWGAEGTEPWARSPRRDSEKQIPRVRMQQPDKGQTGEINTGRGTSPKGEDKVLDFDKLPREYRCCWSRKCTLRGQGIEEKAHSRVS